jgi:hypothetical protein
VRGDSTQLFGNWSTPQHLRWQLEAPNPWKDKQCKWLTRVSVGRYSIIESTALVILLPVAGRELCMGLAEADNLCSVKALYVTPIIGMHPTQDRKRIVLQSNIGIVIRI